MPVYEYKCEDCGFEFEEMLHFSEREDPTNELCQDMIVIGGHMPEPVRCDGKIHLKMSMSSFQLKGSGWYKDGYGVKQKSEETKIKTPEKTSDGVTKARSLVDD